MNKPPQSHVKDFITGRSVPDVGAEANRQQVERLLVDAKGYPPEAVEVDAPISIQVQETVYTSHVDLVVSVHAKRYMVIKCAPGALDSREREVIAAARLLDAYQIPLAVASDGQTAIVWDAVSGNCIGQGLEAIPSFDDAHSSFDPDTLVPLAEEKRERQALIFRSYDSVYLNR